MSRAEYALAAVCVVACQACAGANGRRVDTAPRDSTATARGVILPERVAAAACDGLIEPVPDGFWTPERAQVDALEAALGPFLERAAPRRSRLRRGEAGLRRYRAQYVGVVRGDRETIFANFFCDDRGVDTRRAIVAVDDGGDCYFTVEFDPATAEVSSFAVNGEG
jgi:hypothetical protein